MIGEIQIFLKNKLIMQPKIPNILFQIKDKLIKMLERENRLNLYNKCVKMIPTLVDMEIKGFKTTIFDH